jgi:uncharacterized protein (TIGR03084 family)
MKPNGRLPVSADIFDDLAAEGDQLEAVLAGLPAQAWRSASAAAGWTVADVVLHLAQTEEAVVASATTGGEVMDWRRYAGTVDAAMDAMVRAERGEPAEVFERWRTARRAALAALRQADPQRRLGWVTSPLKPRTLATTRLAEHWAHALDITVPLEIGYPDTARLRHIAWLGHSTLPYAFALAGERPGEVYCELTAPDGTSWSYGSPAADSSISGPAGAFCRVGARRLAPEDSGLVARGPHGVAALRVLRNYADT